MRNVHSALLPAIVGIWLALSFPAVKAQSQPAEAAQPAASTAAAATGSTAATPDTTFDKARFESEVLKRKDLPNFHEVHPFLYRSGGPTQTGMDEIKAAGIRTIIDLRAPSERKGDEPSWAKDRGLKYINLPMSSAAPTKKQVDTFLTAVKHAEENPKDGAVLVHCAHGSDRTGCMVGIWRVKEDGWSYDQAYKEMRKYWFTPKFTNLSGTVRAYADKTTAADKH